MTWSPILSPDDDRVVAAWEAVNAIAAAVEKQAYPPPQRERPNCSYEQPLLFGYLAAVRQDEQLLNLALDRLNEAIDGAAALRHFAGLFGGLCGLGWNIEHFSRLLSKLSQNGLDVEFIDDVDANAEIDDLLIARLKSRHLGPLYDLIGGMVGIGVYFLERLPREQAYDGIVLVLDNLEKISQVADSGGVTWHTPPELMAPEERERNPNGCYNMGVAHGIPGILFLLGEIAHRGIERERALRMLENAMEWFISHQQPPGSQSRFAPIIRTTGDSVDSRPTWCYGDLGILAILTQLARRTGRADWNEFSSDLLEQCLKVAPEDSGIEDAPLCHGAMGNAHIFNRLYQLNGDSRCRDMALRYLDCAFAMRQESSSRVGGGFVTITRPERNGPSVAISSPAFLDGECGIALALLAAIAPVEPEWDRMLLLSGK